MMDLPGSNVLDPEQEPPSKKLKTQDDSQLSGSSDAEQKLIKLHMEPDVGITEYISGHKAFNGVIKQRFSDFLVNEVDLNDEVVRLTDISSIDEQLEKNSAGSTNEESVLTAEWKTKLQKLLDEKNRFQEVHLEVGEDKEERKNIHNEIRKNFRGLESTTGEKDGSKCIIVKFCPGGSRDRKGQDPWPATRGDYCHFVLYKENKDTMDAINVIANMLRMRPGMFTYAGTKDRRAKTCQKVAVRRVTSKRLDHLNRGLRGMAVGNFSYEKEPLKLGDLKGNKFHIILRNIDGEIEDIEMGLKSLKEIGFINYYGMQRFGTTSVPTHHVGKALLQSKWSDAIDLILQPRDSDKDHLHEAREIWSSTRDPEAALKKIGRQGGIEQMLLSGLKKCGKNDSVGALGTLPRNTRLMYVHAYQSYVWNTVVSRRIKQLGLKVTEGDLVLKLTEKLSSSDKKPVTVAKEDVDKYTILDVVLPLPGWDVKYPDNVCGEWYAKLLEEDDLSNELLRNKVKDYSLPGDYRHLVVKPGNVSWNFHQYEDVTKSLVLSDLEKLRGDNLHTSEGQYRALALELTLPSSCYATMALREILKSDTSAGHQTTLNQ